MEPTMIAIGAFFSYLATPQGQVFAEKVNALDDKFHETVKDLVTHIHTKIKPTA